MTITRIDQATAWLRSHQKAAEEMLEHFAAVRGVGAGIGDASCCAVIVGQGRYHFGNSQAYRLDADAARLGRQHAEIVAYEDALANDLTPSTLFCELAPCPGCRTYVAEKDLRIVYLFEHDQVGKADWIAFHGLAVGEQIEWLRRVAGL